MKGMEYSLNRMVPIILIITILSPLNFMSAGSPKSGSAEMSGEEIATSGGFEFRLDEGNGQILHDLNDEEPFATGSSVKNGFLGSSPYPDEYDPDWTSNTRNGFALQFFEGDRVTFPYDPGMDDGQFTLRVSVFPYSVDGERAIFAYEDSDNEMNGLFINDGNLVTRWNGGSVSHDTLAIEPGSWYDIDVFWDPPFEEVHVNGIKIDRQEWRFFTPSISDLKELSFGVLIDGGGYRFPFSGIMDDILISKGEGNIGGIIGSWNFQESTSSGSTLVVDRSGHDNHGTYYDPGGMVDSPNHVDGVYGNCIDFDQHGSYIDCGDLGGGPFSDGSDWSISLWVYPGLIHNGLSSNNISNTFLSYSSPSIDDPDGFEMGLDEDLHILYHVAVEGPDGEEILSGRSKSAISSGEWSHLFLSMEKEIGKWTFNVLVDGFKVFIGPVSLPGPLASDNQSYCNFTIGGSIASTPSFFNGKLDDLIIRSSISNPYSGKNTSIYHLDSDTSDKSMFTDRDLTPNNIQFVSHPKKYGEGSAYFDGASSFLYHTDPDQFLSDPFSVELWVLPLSINQGDVLFSISDGEGNDSIELSLNLDGSMTLHIALDNGVMDHTLLMNSRKRINIDNWSHIRVTYGMGQASISLNGVLDNLTRKDLNDMVISHGFPGQVLMIGARKSIPISGQFNGFIDEIMISDKDPDDSIDTDGDSMSDSYELMRSADSTVFDPLDCNGRYALLVGNNDNRSDKNVGFASANDVRDLRYLLKSLGWLDCDISVLLNRENILGSSYGNLSYIDGTPSRADVVSGLECLGDRSGPSDLVMIFYSGHGDQLPDDDGDEDHFDFSSAGKNMSKQDEQLALSDRLDGDPDQLSDDDYSKLVLEIRAKQMVQIIVSCNSGGFLEDVKQGYNGETNKPWEMYTVITACHENDVAYVKNRESSFLAQSMFDKAMRKTDRDQWGDRKAFGRCDWDPDIDVTINNMRFIEQDGVSEDHPTKVDDPPHWQRNHYTETGYVPGYENGWEGQDFPDSNFLWGETDRATMYVSMLDYSPSNNNGIIDIEEAFYFSVHNEYLGEGSINPEADPNSSTDLGDDPLIFDSDPVSSSKIYL